MSTNTKLSIAGIWLSSLIVTCFVTLKLTGYIASSWWLVLAPILLPIAIVLTVLAINVIMWRVAKK